MSTPISNKCIEVTNQVTDLLTAAGWKNRYMGEASFASSYIGQTYCPLLKGEAIGLFCVWHDSSKTWPIDMPVADMVKEIIAYEAATVYPNATFISDHQGNPTGHASDADVLAKVPFDDGPGNVITYPVTVYSGLDFGEVPYLLAMLEVPFISRSYPDAQHEKAAVMAACKAAITHMRANCSPGNIVFPLDHDGMPHRCVISVAIPIRKRDTRQKLKARVSMAFNGYSDRNQLFKTRGEVVFHDRGTGGATRAYTAGKIVLMSEISEPLCSSTSEEVEAQLLTGATSGYTSNPAYPEWQFNEASIY